MTVKTGGGGVRVALVHDFPVGVRGAERVFLAASSASAWWDCIAAQACARNAERFDTASFRHDVQALVDRASPRRPAGLAWQA